MSKYTITFSKEHGGNYYRTTVEAIDEKDAFTKARDEAIAMGIHYENKPVGLSLLYVERYDKTKAEKIANKISAAAKGRKMNFTNETRLKLSLNMSKAVLLRKQTRRPIIIDNIPYATIADAAKFFNRSTFIIKRRIESDKFPNYKFVI